MAVRRSVRYRRWIDLAAGAVIVVAALEEANYLRRRLAREAQAWWQDLEHRDHYGIERSTMDALVPRIFLRRLRT